MVKSKQNLQRDRRAYLTYLAQLRAELDSLFGIEAPEEKFEEVNLEIELSLKKVQNIDNDIRKIK